MPSIELILIYAAISEYLSKYDRGKLLFFSNGNVPTQDLSDLIYQVRKPILLKYLEDVNGIVAEVDAIGTITIDTIGKNDDRILVQVDDPLFGLVDLAYYIKIPADNTINVIANKLNILLNANVYGYTSVVNDNVVTITARNNVGANINGKLIVTYIPATDYLTINNLDLLMINNSDKLLITI